jgi:alginate O-acetyltransferase complex protein AlgI
MHYLSPEFALLFLLFLWLYWFVGLGQGVRAQNGLLLLASYAFYSAFDLRFLALLLVFSLLITALAHAMARTNGAWRRVWMLTGISLALGNLAIFKYYNFFREAAQGLLDGHWQDFSLPVLDLLLPLGISFYTFSGIAYLVSVYQQERPAASLADTCLHLAFFPTLLAGPICRPSELLSQIQQTDARQILRPHWALLLLLSALVKKVWLASALAEHWVNPVFSDPVAFHAIDLVAAVLAYAWQLYFDFSGYTDAVTALALLLGFQLPDNFKAPYLAQSLSDFWQRWHITLSRWIRDYVYIPLGGSRGSWGRTQINLLLAMGLSGLWHGAAVTFVLWGLWHGVGLVLQNAWRRISPWRLPLGLAQGVTFMFVCAGWVLFRAEDTHALQQYLQGLGQWQGAQRHTNSLLLALLLPAFWLAHSQGSRVLLAMELGLQRLSWWHQSLLVSLAALCVIELAPSGMPGFIYFGF